MADSKILASHWQNWTLFGLRWLFVVGLSAAHYLWLTQQETQPPNTNNLGMAAVVSGLIIAAYGISFIVKQFRPVAPYVIMVGDVVIAGAFVYATDGHPTFLPFIMFYIAATGLLRLGPIFGSIQALGVVAVSLGVMLFVQDPEDLNMLVDPYSVPVLGAIVGMLAVLGWVYVRDTHGSGHTHQLSQLVHKNTQELQNMRERARAITDLTNALTGTRDHAKILDIALGIGQLSLNRDVSSRMISIVFLYSSDDTMYIATSRGLPTTEESSIILGTEGLVAEALEESMPMIGYNIHNDPELGRIGGLKRMRSALVIPLRAHYNNYGVLVFASGEADAFDEDHIDTLHSLGVQATIALHNSVLYDDLMAEKERIIQMEEDSRKALVRDLHDIPTQTISAVAMRIRIIMRMMERDPGQVMDELQNVEGMALRATEEIRHVLFKLRPLALESQGLKVALEQLASKMIETYKQNMSVKVAADVESSLDEAKQGALFYLIEEAANNARKYAEAELIRVQVMQQDGTIVARIHDNGKGLDIEGIEGKSVGKGSFGMTNMRERAELMDGTFDLKSAPGKGTLVVVRIPVDPITNGQESRMRTSNRVGV